MPEILPWTCHLAGRVRTAVRTKARCDTIILSGVRLTAVDAQAAGGYSIVY